MQLNPREIRDKIIERDLEILKAIQEEYYCRLREVYLSPENCKGCPYRNMKGCMNKTDYLYYIGKKKWEVMEWI